jgi:hypothetical protein
MIAQIVGISTKVYSMPDLTLEHTYAEGSVRRINLENAGEKYLLDDFNNNQVKVYNSDHSLWKTFAAPRPENAFSTYFVSLLENPEDAAGPIQVGYSFWYNNGTEVVYEAKLVNENKRCGANRPGRNRFFAEQIRRCAR